MKVVDVCAFYSPSGGGVKTYVEQKLAMAPSLGHELTILAPGERFETQWRGPGAKLVTLPSPRFPLDRKYWYFADEALLHATLDAEAPDVVEASSPWRSASMVARWQGSARRALVMHADPLAAYSYRWLEPLFKRDTIDQLCGPFWTHLRELGAAFDIVVCASNDLRQRLAQGGVANTALVPMGVETAVFSPRRADPELRSSLLAMCGLPPSASLLVAAGRLAPEKRWPLIIDAVTAASHQRPIGLVMLGAGRQRARILRQIGGNPHIRLLEPIRDRGQFATLLASCDALIHACEAETFCMAAAEARASGVPVIVPASGGAADHALGGGGITYRPGSALAASRAILHLLDRVRSDMGPQPRSLSQRDHFVRLFEAYANLNRAIAA